MTYWVVMAHASRRSVSGLGAPAQRGRFLRSPALWEGTHARPQGRSQPARWEGRLGGGGRLRSPLGSGARGRAGRALHRYPSGRRRTGLWLARHIPPPDALSGALTDGRLTRQTPFSHLPARTMAGFDIHSPITLRRAARRRPAGRLFRIGGGRHQPSHLHFLPVRYAVTPAI